MTKEEVKQKIISEIKWGDKNPQKLGGQSCGFHHHIPTLISESMGIEISIGYYRSSLKNKEMALTLFELVLDEIVRTKR